MIQFSNIASTYNEYLDTLYSYALHLGFDEQTAMDAIHDVFYKLCTHHSSLNEINNLKSYLFRSLRNRLIDIKRINRENTTPFTGQDDVSEGLPFQLHITIEDELIMKEDTEEICRKVENVLNRLTDRQREIVYLRYIKEQGYEEIAEIMQISVAACRNLVSKSISKLKESSLTISLLLLVVK
ncbi:RNA polymerase sigma factor [Proteiniphilum acetatigenes]|uniref:RNA polymerase sigma factor n=1 Tax=Proteiniphilum acetatigenes TaxID=294710 RepID=UPI000362E912|nr:sigma-70 family RNA polymerase sigma factor [Proteiniphilum acetatigenes]SFK34953.1 RNA polymerase sigma factor, sigma-70 family [Porphyromonadaceae bacterium KH3CP3RA]